MSRIHCYNIYMSRIHCYNIYMSRIHRVVSLNPKKVMDAERESDFNAELQKGNQTLMLSSKKCLPVYQEANFTTSKRDINMKLFILV